jgi:soluble lytic murein transglycosylase-like protein
MSTTELVLQARAIAVAHGLSPQLVCAVIEQESAWNPWSVRYEPVFMSKYVAPQYTAGKFSATEAYMRSISWGLMQLIGETARELGFAGSSLAELCDPQVGVEFGCRELKNCIDRAKGDVPTALLYWNGGASTSYPVEVMARMKNYSAGAS